MIVSCFSALSVSLSVRPCDPPVFQVGVAAEVNKPVANHDRNSEVFIAYKSRSAVKIQSIPPQSETVAPFSIRLAVSNIRSEICKKEGSEGKGSSEQKS